MKKRKKLFYPRFNRTVKVGDTLTVKMMDGVPHKYKVAEFSSVSNEPISDTGRMIYLDFVVWD